MLSGKTVILGVTGSIAAYKAASLASMLVKAHADVHVVMSSHAVNIINPIAFETLTHHKCYLDTFDRNFEYDVHHIALAKKADIFVVAPATANVIAKMANGICDDMLSTTFVAFSGPKLFAPAMNTGMFDNPVTQDNIKKCQSYGYKMIEPSEGYLACGDTGRGKMAEPEAIFEHICHEIQYKHDLEGKKILITAGPTQEAIDPVRYITNHSTGKMGYALAKVASYRGADVTLVSGPVSLSKPLFVKTVDVKSARDMFEAVTARSADNDIIIKAAAVADYRPSSVSDEKIKKMEGDASIPLERTDDILKYLGEHKRDGQFLCGFSMETQNMKENSRAKLVKKNLDMIVANNLKVQGAGFGTDTNVVTMITGKKEVELPVLTKEQVSSRILDGIIYGL